MANTLIQPQYISLNSKRIAFVTGSSIDLASNDERQIALEGVVGHSDGVATCDFEIKTIVTLTGSDDAAITDILINKEYCEIQATLGSQTVVVTTRCVSFSGNSEAQNGKFEGSYKFESSGPFSKV
jgi:hypothetical protein